MSELSDFSTFGERLRHAMEVAEVSAEALAGALNHASTSSVSEYLNDRTSPRGPTVAKIAEGLGHPEWAGWLLNGAGDTPGRDRPKLVRESTWTAYVQRRIIEYQMAAEVATEGEKQRSRRAIAEGVKEIVSGLSDSQALAVASIFLDAPRPMQDSDEGQSDIRGGGNG